MACLQHPCLSSINAKLSPPKPTLFPRTHYLKPFKISSSADSSPYPPENLSTDGQNQNPNGTAPIGDGGEGAKKIPEAVRVAMERAREYKRNKGLGKGQVISEGICLEFDFISGFGELVDLGNGVCFPGKCCGKVE